MQYAHHLNETDLKKLFYINFPFAAHPMLLYLQK